MKKLKFTQMSLGCDPEFFFTKEGNVCGSEKVLHKNGLVIDNSYSSSGKIIRDGVQAELNPRPNTCRANLAMEISRCFETLYEKIKEDKSISLEFSQVVKISKKELDSLSKKSKEFGCAPSNNIYTQKENKVSVDGSIYKYRLAGGHIHMGRFCGNYSNPESMNFRINKAISTPERLVPLLDILLGNTCVLMDKDPNAKKRRKLYGQAGDYRTPKHGLEYRTLSNFWITAYPLMSFVMGMTRFAILVLASSFESDGNDELERSIVTKVKQPKIKQAINNNDFALALKNFSQIENSILEMTDGAGYESNYPITRMNIKEFKYFIQKPLSYWFKENPIEHWMRLDNGHGRGWESYCEKTIKPDMNKIKNKVVRKVKKIVGRK